MNAPQLEYLKRSAIYRHHFFVYGGGTQYTGLRQCKVEKLLELLPVIEDKLGATHILMADSVDTLFVGDMEQIKREYVEMGAPDILFAGEKHCQPRPEFEGMLHAIIRPTSVWAFPNTGGYIGRIESLKEMWAAGLRRFGGLENDQDIVHSMIVDGGLWDFQVDHQCRIWQCEPDDVEVGEIDRAKMSSWRGYRNKVTGMYPHILHFNGGYCDPQTGRLERMKPWADELLPCREKSLEDFK
jgi:hypothetical protein